MKPALVADDAFAAAAQAAADAHVTAHAAAAAAEAEWEAQGLPRVPAPPAPPLNVPPFLRDNGDSAVYAAACIEQVCLDDKVLSVPFDLFEVEHLTDVLSMEAFDTLGEEQQEELARLLPEGFDRQALQHLLSGANVRFGNPVNAVGRQMAAGERHPRVMAYREGLAELQRRQHAHVLRDHHNGIVRTMLAMREVFSTLPEDASLSTRLEAYRAAAAAPGFVPPGTRSVVLADKKPKAVPAVPLAQNSWQEQPGQQEQWEQRGGSKAMSRPQTPQAGSGSVSPREAPAKANKKRGCPSVAALTERGEAPVAKSPKESPIKSSRSISVSLEGEALARFHEEERRRYESPFEPFRYTSLEGKPAAVAAAAKKGSKGREKPTPHTMLDPDRPVVVSFASLVRDAVARLPGGEGTKADIVYLVCRSQYFAGHTATQHQKAVSVGTTLDRLQKECDPCVQNIKGGWGYLHLGRSDEDFEKAAAAAARERKRRRKYSGDSIEGAPAPAG